MDEATLAYFRLVVADPAAAPAWAEWWAANAERVERTFPLVDFVRLKHRGALGAKQILQQRGELPKDPPAPGR